MSWEPIANLTNTPEAIEEFHLEHPDAPQQIRRIPRRKEDTQPMELKKLFGWQDGKFELDYLEWLGRAWERWKGRGQATVWDDKDNTEEFVRTQILNGG